MFFERLSIRGFGCLRTEVIFAPEKVNLAIADNEMGKSTLIAALLAAFYGIVEDERKTRDKRPYRKNVLPWINPEEFGLTCEFNDGRIPWLIERDFHEGSVRLIDRDTDKDHAHEYHKGRGVYRIGEELIGLTCDDFLKSFYLKQEEILDIRDAGGLTPHVQRVATAQDGEATSEVAIERLRQALKRYPHPSSKDGLLIENAIKRYDSERDDIMEEISRLDRERAEIEPQCNRLTEIDRDLEDRKSEREENRSLGDLAEIRELTRLIEAQDRLRTECDQLAEEADGLKDYASFPADKGDQLNNITGRIEELEGGIAKGEESLESTVVQPLTEVEETLQEHRELAGVTEVELREFETTFSRLSDRRERCRKAKQERDRLYEKLATDGFDEEHLERLKSAFANISARDTRFIEEFRVSYAEEEAVYREAKTRREWLNKDSEEVNRRRSKIIASARLFLIMAAVMAIAGGALMLLTQGGWLGSVLAGLGIVFGAVGFIIRGTAGSVESSGLKRLSIDLEVAVGEEDDARKKLDAIGSQLTVMAAGAGFKDGNELLAEYTTFIRQGKLALPLSAAERDLARSIEEADQSMEQIRPFFDRAGQKLPDDEESSETIQELLERYRTVVRTGEEYRSLKSRQEQLEEELQRLKRDLDSQRELAGEILRMARLEMTEPLTEALASFRESLKSHQRYMSIIKEQLPRARQDLLPEVDLTAKRDRQDQLSEQITRQSTKAVIDHSKEYYRDQADRAVLRIEELSEEIHRIKGRVKSVMDKYQSHHPKLRTRVEEIGEAIERAERFRSEIENAVRIMSDLSRDVYRSWAAALSEDAAPFLRALNPRYSELKFDEDLTFNILDSKTSRTISSAEVETVLSSGARDEVFLAARLGISSYLARGARGPLPIILDEPLASMDDDKFITGMRFFMDVLSRQHQVLIMSCHAERHRWLAEQMPELVREQVHYIQLSSES